MSILIYIDISNNVFDLLFFLKWGSRSDFILINILFSQYKSHRLIIIIYQTLGLSHVQ